MNELYDMHSHLDFAQDSEHIAAASAKENITAIDSTVIPSSFVSSTEKFEDCKNIHVSLGLHPWWMASGRASEVDIDRFENLIIETKFIGEIGLDFADKYKSSKDIQISTLIRIFDVIKNCGADKLITLHTVKASTQLLDLVEKNKILQDNKAILHWFSGSHEEFGRAVSDGFYFSVGMRMLANPKTRIYAQSIPDEQLLLETDSPAHEGDIYSADVWRQELDNALTDLAELRGVDRDSLAEIISANSRYLIG